MIKYGVYQCILVTSIHGRWYLLLHWNSDRTLLNKSVQLQLSMYTWDRLTLGWFLSDKHGPKNGPFFSEVSASKLWFTKVIESSFAALPCANLYLWCLASGTVFKWANIQDFRTVKWDAIWRCSSKLGLSKAENSNLMTYQGPSGVLTILNREKPFHTFSPMRRHLDICRVHSNLIRKFRNNVGCRVL